MAFYTPPNPVRREGAAHTKPQRTYLDSLLDLHNKGIISKEELREKVLAWTPSPSPQPKPELPRKKKRHVVDENNATPEGFNKKSTRTPLLKKCKKTRPGRPASKVAALRKVVKDPTRCRFFKQCANPASVLWSTTKNGKEEMNKILFVRAAKDPMDFIFAKNPGTTFDVHPTKMLNLINWQVYKDRQNYAHTAPKRQMVFGELMPYDWEGELSKINAMQPADRAIILGRRRVPQPQQRVPRPEPQPQQPTPQPEPQPQQPETQPQQPAPQPETQPQQPTPQQPPPPVVGNTVDKNANGVITIDLDLMSTCSVCGINVWIGKQDCAPPAVENAYPLGSDWTCNAEPYCEDCWGFETQMLNDMGAQHKAMGPKNKTTDDTQSAAAKKKQAAAATAAKKKQAAAAAAAKKKQAAAAAAAKKKQAAAAKKKQAAVQRAAKKMKYKVS